MPLLVDNVPRVQLANMLHRNQWRRQFYGEMAQLAGVSLEYRLVLVGALCRF